MKIEETPMYQSGYTADIEGRDSAARFLRGETREKYEAGHARGQEERKSNEQ